MKMESKLLLHALNRRLRWFVFGMLLLSFISATTKLKAAAVPTPNVVASAALTTLAHPSPGNRAQNDSMSSPGHESKHFSTVYVVTRNGFDFSPFRFVIFFGVVFAIVMRSRRSQGAKTFGWV